MMLGCEFVVVEQKLRLDIVWRCIRDKFLLKWSRSL